MKVCTTRWLLVTMFIVVAAVGCSATTPPPAPTSAPRRPAHGRSTTQRWRRDREGDHLVSSGLIIEVPEAEGAVAAWRKRLDPQAALGVPAHITVLFPFAAADRLDDSSIAILSRLVASVGSFEFHLVRTAWSGETTLWLAPEPAAPFNQLTELLSGAFPAYPPYGGQFAEVVPHLTR
jgi:2'-5' RNA ligase superfamily